MNTNSEGNTEPRNTEPQSELFDLEYTICTSSPIGRGSNATVFEVIDQDHAVFAIKCQRVREGVRKLKEESEIYQRLSQSSGPPNHDIPPSGFPSGYVYCNCGSHELFVLDRLGKTLAQIASESDGGRLTQKDVFMIGIQAVRRLQYCHCRGILHCDIKPGNFAMGVAQNKNKTVHLFDFGDSVFIEDWGTYDYKKKVDSVATPYFASTNVLLHHAPTRMDDMESLGYTLIWLTCGSLPWSTHNPETGLQYSHSEMAHHRLSSLIRHLCGNIPALMEFMRTVLTMSRNDEPDYDILIKYLKAGLSVANATDDGNFAWLSNTNVPHQ